ncbi:hypothetical protein BN8_03335 [Fibrisoma limi BUZ 3]|uniref:Uncharacterized protein n=2 Tax=Fibrisoma limi TaxID=663275 RepID=I2GJW4_9BACT|nr:hypothetical protein BN8_03335 [Fibrisoma limi BUZ 3]
MAFSEADYAQIDAYLHNQLTESEKQALEERLRNESDFAAEVEWFRSFIQNYQQLRTRETVEAINQQLRSQAANETPSAPADQDGRVMPLPTDQSVGRRSFRPVWLAAAAIGTVVLSLGIWFSLRQTTDEKPVVVQRTEPTPTRPAEPTTEPEKTSVPTVTPSTREQSRPYLNDRPRLAGQAPAELRSAIDALDNDDPAAALRLLSRVRPQATKPRPADAPAPTTDTAVADDEPLFGAAPTESATTTANAATNRRLDTYRQFYTGLSYLRNGQPEQALRVLNKVKAPLREAADWYSALSYLQLNQPAPGKRLLNQISASPNHPYRNDAQKLLNQLQ